jgi:hypothetical protein
LALLALVAGNAFGAELPRRGTLGLALAPTEDGQALKIVKITNPNAPAVQVDDIVVSINGKPLSGPQGVGAGGATYGMRPGEAARVTIVRAGATLEVSVTAFEAPPPVLDGRAVEMGEAQAKGGPRVRTFFLAPTTKALARNGRVPAVMILPGIPCGTVETFGAPGHPYAKLFKMLTDAGFAAVMADKPGQGDSEGTPCLDGGYDAEEQAFRAAARRFVSDKRVDAKRFYVVGLSLGGIQAPAVAESVASAGIVTWGTGVTPWHDYLLTTFRRRAVLEGEAPDENAWHGRHWRRVLTALMDGKSIDEVTKLYPQSVAAVTAGVGDLSRFAGRSWTFHREIDRAPTVRGWNAFDGKLLALHGEFDWVAERHDHRLAVDIVNRRHPGHAVFEILPGNDHAFSKHKTLADSFAKFGQGEPDEAFFQRSVAWLTTQAAP